MSFFKRWYWQKREVRCQTCTPSFCRAFPETYIACWIYPEYSMVRSCSVYQIWYTRIVLQILLLLLQLLVLIR